MTRKRGRPIDTRRVVAGVAAIAIAQHALRRPVVASEVVELLNEMLPNQAPWTNLRAHRLMQTTCDAGFAVKEDTGFAVIPNQVFRYLLTSDENDGQN